MGLSNAVSICPSFVLITITLIIWTNFNLANGQNSSSDCARIFKGLRRVGANLGGRLELPVDEAFPKFQLLLKFSRPIHHITVRHLRARRIGSRGKSNFLIDPADIQQDGVLRIGTNLRLTHVFAPTPKLLGVVNNGKQLCGENLFDESEAIIIGLKTTTQKSTKFKAKGVVDGYKLSKATITTIPEETVVEDDEDEIFSKLS